ncbi:MAG: hypothetical protein UY48_C0008G0022 [Candidatus Gottesmanbacteria bacterium GW2011_GWB1_49_7]|uniref:Uncharacterized protein n=1 Tax=Candidatus Gottesmanbacteria bacterium GW2011_GWB1_49_7 TaxID=1618448 RepID=A0A0G1YD09_9BACT|nr:MAG: hypothetical protein UY48_C0008G0022 [Candidatus Gottesmanbacteria bacterium GW2011_GWB1_49_7]
MRHPIQPLEKDTHGVLRFKRNEVVCYLLDNGPFDLNQLAMMVFSQEDREQFAQLIGYSLSGFNDLLPYVSDETKLMIQGILQGQTAHEAQLNCYRGELNSLRRPLRQLCYALFGTDPDQEADDGPYDNEG